MDTPVPRQDRTVDDESDEPTAIVTQHEPRPGKAVFVERDNPDGWIATSLTVDCWP